ncbi:uncharacterized protein LOC122037762 [Zingiber officinale]|uniref:uncharacterized protein LOC122037762 n=1 Tax=Zingiber officinale TaxID=94328 RepID=UPI001C4D84B2|nr:uncharacterized protein LOC122037762 [Zingiber officinale]
MKIASWNVRGFNQAPKQQEVQSFFLRHKLAVMGVLETKLTEQAFQRIKTRRFQNLEMQHYIKEGSSRSRVLVIWDPHQVTFGITKFDEQYLHGHVTSAVTQKTFQITIVYGLLSISKRRRLWEGLDVIGESMNTPWILLGDFNSPISVEDKEGGMPVTAYQISDFQDCVLHNGLEDLPQVGCKYTWSNMEVSCKLDRSMVNKMWMEQDMRGLANYLPPGYISDHTPCVVNIMVAIEQPKKPFKFFNMWTTHEDYNKVMEEQWVSIGLGTLQGKAQFRFKVKLQRLKATFRQFNRLHFQHIKERSLRAQEELQRMQENDYATGIFEDGYQQVRKRADKLSRTDFLYCKQKAKCKYFKEVDRNTTYFHALVKRTNR